MSTLLTRRQLTALLAAAPIPALPLGTDLAQSALDIRRGSGFQPIPIAITNFQGDGGAQATQIITNNFRRSVFLKPLDPATFLEKATNPEAPQIEQWKMINAQFVVTGRAARGTDGRLKTEFRLWDVASGQQVAGQQYVTDPNNARRVAHIVSDAIFSRITGEKGWCDSRVVFVDESGPKERRVKRLPRGERPACKGPLRHPRRVLVERPQREEDGAEDPDSERIAAAERARRRALVGEALAAGLLHAAHLVEGLLGGVAGQVRVARGEDGRVDGGSRTDHDA
jgi:hypothetical protein